MGQVRWETANPAVVGKTYINGGSLLNFSFSKKSGTLPAWGTYRINSCTLYISAIAGDGDSGATVITFYNGAQISNSWNHASPGVIPFPTDRDYSGLSTISLQGWNLSTNKGATGGAIASGAYLYVVLDYTPYASSFTLSKSSMDAGTAQTVTIAPNDNAFTHKITYTLGSASVTRSVAAGVKTDTYTIPMDWLNQMKNSVGATVSVKVQTYSGSTLNGTVTKTFTLTCPTSVVPTLGDLSTSPNGSTAAGADLYVKNRTGVSASITSSGGAYGSTVAATGIDVGGLGGSFRAESSSISTSAIPTSGNVVITYWVVDSRGRKTTKQKTISVLAYSLPVLTIAKAYRTDEDGTINPAGVYAKFEWALSRSAVGGSYATRVSVKYNGVEIAYSNNGVSGSGFVMSGESKLECSLTETYEVTIQSWDSYTATPSMYVTRIAVIPTAGSAISFTKGIDGAAFGMVAQKSKVLEIAGDWTVIVGSGVVAPSQNPNLLDNWEFGLKRNTVNQRGATTYTTGSTIIYTVDRWKTSNCKIFLGDIWLRMSNVTDRAIFQQPVELSDSYKSKVMTFSVEIYSDSPTNVYLQGYDGINHYSYRLDSSTSGQWQICAVTFTVSADATCLNLQVVSYTDFYIKRAKLEFGSISTLANDPPMSFPTELLKCQRYFFRDMNFYSRSVNNRTGVDRPYRFATPYRFPVVMRTTPTVKIYYDISDGTSATGAPQLVSPCGASMPNVSVPADGWFDLNGIEASAEL